MGRNDDRDRNGAGRFDDGIDPETALEVFERLEDTARPLTAADVADELGIARRTAHNKLNRLVDRDAVDTRKVGARGRVYWVPHPAGERALETPDAIESRETPPERSDTRDDETPTPTDAASEGANARRDSGRAQEGATDTAGDDVDLRALLDEWPPAGQQKREQRRQAGLAALEYIRDVGAATAGDVKDAAEPDAPVDGQSPDTWWRKSARPALERARDAGLVTFTDGSKVWEWIGESDDVQGAGEQGDDTPTSSGVYDPTKEF